MSSTLHQDKTTVYVLKDERNQVRYVGKTHKALEHRLFTHVYAAKKGAKWHVHNWIRTMLSAKAEPTIHKIAEVDGVGDEAERFYIAWFRMLGAKLTNMTEGGEGVIHRGWKHKKETIEKLKIARSRRGPMSAETKLKMSIAHSNPSAESRKKMSIAGKGRQKTEEHKRKIGNSNKGKTVVYTNEWRRNIGLAHKGMKRSAETREKIRRALTGKKRVK